MRVISTKFYLRLRHSSRLATRVFSFCCKSLLGASIESSSFFISTFFHPRAQLVEILISPSIASVWRCVGTSKCFWKWPLCIEHCADEFSKSLKQSRSDVLNDKWTPNALVHVLGSLANVTFMVQRFFMLLLFVILTLSCLRSTY